MGQTWKNLIAISLLIIFVNLLVSYLTNGETFLKSIGYELNTKSTVYLEPRSLQDLLKLDHFDDHKLPLFQQSINRIWIAQHLCSSVLNCSQYRNDTYKLHSQEELGYFAENICSSQNSSLKIYNLMVGSSPIRTRLTVFENTMFYPNKTDPNETIQLNCNLNPTYEKRMNNRSLWNQTLVSDKDPTNNCFSKKLCNYLQTFEVVDKPLKCDHYVNHTVIWMTRYSTHMYHAFMDDYLSLYYFIFIFKIDPAETQIYFTNLFDGVQRFPNNPLPMHEFFYNRSTFGYDYSTSQRVKPNTCFKKSYFSPEPNFFMLDMNEKIKCLNPILFGFQKWVLGSHNFTHPAEITKRIVYLSRGIPLENDDKGLNGERDLLDHIKKNIPKDWTFEVYSFRFSENVSTHNTPEYYGVHFKEQVKLIYNATILIAPHGAQLSHAVWLKQGSHVIEIEHANREHFGMYYNLCTGLGIKYTGGPSHGKSPLNVSIQWKVIDRAINRIHNYSYSWPGISHHFMYDVENEP